MKGIGTMQVAITDDDENEHRMQIHNVLFAPDSPANLLSPQLLLTGAKHSEDGDMIDMWTLNHGTTTWIIWDNSKFCKTIEHELNQNIPLLEVNRRAGSSTLAVPYAHEAFRNDCKANGQDLIFCGVGNHTQNGIVERRIRDVVEKSRTSLAHGMCMWPEAVSPILWPFSLKSTCRTRNHYHLNDAGLSPIERATRIKSKRDIRNEHTFFVPFIFSILNCKDL